MNIVILDAYALNPGDLDWGPIQKLGKVTLYERSALEDVVERAKDAEIVLTNKAVLDRNLMKKLPKLKYIGVMATGYNNVDVETAKERNIVVTNVKGYSSESVAQHSFALLLALSNRIETHSHEVYKGEWTHSIDWTFRKTPLVELAGKTMGLIGLGDIGIEVAKIANAFGMKVLAYRKNPERTRNGLIKMCSQEEVFKESDVLSLHCPLTAETNELINANRLAKMKRNAYLINTGRGGLINEADLAEALQNGRIAGAGLDVLSSEPPAADNPLLRAPHCIITPHIAWASFEARERLIGLIADNIIAFSKGEPINRVV